MNSVWEIVKEQWQHRQTAQQLAWFELKTKYSGNVLGILWIVLNPLLQIGVYWFAFGVGLKSGQPINGVPYVYWLTVGLIAWFYLNQSISTGVASIYSRISILTKMSFPVSIVPTFIVGSQLIEHLGLLVIVLLILGVQGYAFHWTLLQLPYYVLATTCFLISANLLLATLATAVRDVKLLMNSVMRFGMFLSPVVWNPDHLSVGIQQLLRLNPMFYLIEGYRDALLGTGVWFYDKPSYTIYFWGFTLMMFVVGAVLNKRLRRHLLDYM